MKIAKDKHIQNVLNAKAKLEITDLQLCSHCLERKATEIDDLCYRCYKELIIDLTFDPGDPTIPRY